MGHDMEEHTGDRMARGGRGGVDGEKHGGELGREGSGQLDDLDLALIRSLRAAPPEPMASVAGEVMRGLAARERRLAVIRWATVVGAASVAAVVLNAFGSGIAKFLYRAVFHGETSAGLQAYGKVIDALRQVFSTLALKVFNSSIGHDLSPYSGQIWLAAGGGLVVVLLVMYLMGVWLGKPKEGKRWLFGRSLHNGLQVW